MECMRRGSKARALHTKSQFSIHSEGLGNVSIIQVHLLFTSCSRQSIKFWHCVHFWRFIFISRWLKAFRIRCSPSICSELICLHKKKYIISIDQFDMCVEYCYYFLLLLIYRLIISFKRLKWILLQSAWRDTPMWIENFWHRYFMMRKK